MKIIFCHKNTVPDGKMGGFSTVYFNLAKQLVNFGHDVTILTKHTVAPTCGIKFHKVNALSRNQIVYSQEISQICRLLSPDVIECPSWASECWHYSISEDKPFPLFVRGDIPAIEYGEIDASKREHEMMSNASATYAVSHAMKDQIMKAYNISVDKIIHNGVDTDVFKPLRNRHVPFSDSTKRILWVGRPTTVKGFDILCDVISQSPSNFSYNLVLGSARNALPLVIPESDAKVKIHKGLELNKLIALYNSVDVVLSTSRFEGFGLAVLEALACGTPAVIPVDGTGMLEFVINDETGLHYTSTSDAIDKIRSIDPTFSTNCVEMAQSFSWKNCASRTLEMYQAIIQ